MRTILKVLMLLTALSQTADLYPQEQSQDKGRFEIDLSELQKEVDKVATKPYHLGGFFEYQPILMGIDRDSAVSRVRFYNDKQGPLFDQYNFRLRLEGGYKKDWFSMFFKTDTLVRNDFQGWDEDSKVFESYVSAKPSANFILEAGKKVMKEAPAKAGGR